MKASRAVLLLLLAACNKPAPPPAFERPPAPVTVVPATAGDVPFYLDEIGRSVARETVMLQPQVSGRVTDVLFKDGADLHKGDKLFVIDARPFQNQKAAAEAAVAESQATLDLATSEYLRVSAPDMARAVSKQDIEARKNAVEVAKARLKQHEAAVAAAELNIEYCDIRSRIDGRAGQRLVDAGNIVTANVTSMLVIQRIDSLYVDFSVAERHLPTVRGHLKAHPLTTEIRLPDDPANVWTGDLTFIDTAVQESTGTVRLRASVENQDRRLWAGQFVKVRLILDTLKGAVLVPATASQLSAQGTFVYVVKEDSTAELRPIVAGQRHGELIVVQQGLKSGERVVVLGQLGVMPGAKVRVVEPATPAQAGAKQ